MKFQITVIDVNHRPVDATLDYVATQPTAQVNGKTDALGGNAELTLPDDVWIISIAIAPKAHENDFVRVQRASGSAEWQVDNPVCRLNGSDREISLTCMVGRLRSAPTMHVPDDQIAKLAGRPNGVLIYKTNNGYIYHSLFADEYDPFRRLRHPILDSKLDKKALEWERLRAERCKVPDPKKRGIFYHLEYGERQSGLRLFLSLYLPSSGARRVLDYIVFFSPSTAISKFLVDHFPFRGDYPYGLINKSDQCYPRHSQNYLFSGVHLVHQMLAVQSKAAIVMPVAAYGDWSVFQTKSGLQRLLLECSLFLHRELLTTQQAAVRPGWPEYAYAGGSTRQLTGMGAGAISSIFARYDPLPPIGRVAVAAFSSGSVPLYKLLVDQGGLPEGYEDYKASFGADESAFNSVFREVWDIDGAHSPYHGYPAFEKALAAWYGHGKDVRRFRLYHSQYTGGDRDSMEQVSLKYLTRKDDILNNPIVEEQGAVLWAHERHAADGKWSCVRFADGFISSKSTTSDKPYWMLNDAHHFMPKICLGHAALLFNTE
jgi:hypothetical protein